MGPKKSSGNIGWALIITKSAYRIVTWNLEEKVLAGSLPKMTKAKGWKDRTTAGAGTEHL